MAVFPLLWGATIWALKKQFATNEQLRQVQDNQIRFEQQIKAGPSIHDLHNLSNRLTKIDGYVERDRHDLDLVIGQKYQ